jgi:hypothetical protein
MGFLITCAVIVALGWVTFRSMNRDKAARDRAEAVKVRVRQAHGIEDLFVSREDGGFVGLSGDGARIILGQGDDGRSFPVAAITAIEGLRDGLVLIRAEPNGDPVAPAPVAEQDITDVPERIRSLSLRVTLDQDTHTIPFFDGGRHGADPINEGFRSAAAQTEAWFRKLSTAMRLAQAA